MAAVWIAILILGAIPVELAARKKAGYRLTHKGLHLIRWDNTQQLKRFNRIWYEKNPVYFEAWPQEAELFESDQETPRYLFKRNRRMVKVNDRLVPARPGQNPYWSSNSWGFRGPEFSIKKNRETLRIVCLGASTTEGAWIADDETYPHFLNLELGRLLSDRKVEVINAGHSAHGMDDLLAVLTQRVLPLDPDIVVFYEGNNNIDWRSYVAVAPCDFGICWLHSRPFVYRLLSRGSAFFLSLSDRLGWNDEPPRLQPHRLDLSESTPSVKAYREGLKQLVDESKKAGSSMIIASFISLPYEGLKLDRKENAQRFDDLYRPRSPITPGEMERAYDLFNDQAEEVARQTQTPFLDLASMFPKEPKYFPFDVYHLGPEANRIVAQKVARFLVDEVIPRPQLSSLAGQGSRLFR